MKRTAEGFICTKCGKSVPAESEKRMAGSRKNVTDGIYVVDQSVNRRARISQVCPKCGNGEAFQWVSSISGEHAGIRRERTIEHFTCTKCSHSWNKAS